MLVAAYEDNVFFLASALTFDALVASLPFVLLTLGVLGYLVHGAHDPISSVHAIVDRFLPLPAGGRDPLAPAEQALVVAAESRRQLSTLGVPLFLWFSIRFFGAVRQGLHEVFDTDETRPWLMAKAVDLLLVMISVAVLAGNTVEGFVLGTAIWPTRLLRRTLSFLLGGILFYAVYTIAPGRAVRRKTAVLAATVAALAFELARFLYGFYLARFATVDRLFSNANVIGIALLLVWMYYTAVVFLLGGEVADTYDLMRRQREQRAILT